MTACYDNAASLLDDARCLAHEARFARAGALVVLALEELAKIPDLHDTAVSAPSTTPSPWPEFWKRFQSHEGKQKRIGEYGKWLVAYLGGATPFENPGPYAAFLPSDLGRSLDMYKQRSFYVDFWNGRFGVPGTAPSDLGELVDGLYALALERADSFGQFHATRERSTRLLKGNVAQAAGGSITAAVAGGDAAPTEDAKEIAIDLHSLLANRSSALLPDYASLYALSDELTKGCPTPAISAVFDREATVLSARMNERRLPTAGARALSMVKLLYGLAERRGIKLDLSDLAEPAEG
jgi:AbiV family abortive infection protein